MNECDTVLMERGREREGGREGGRERENYTIVLNEQRKATE